MRDGAVLHNAKVEFKELSVYLSSKYTTVQVESNTFLSILARHLWAKKDTQ